MSGDEDDDEDELSSFLPIFVAGSRGFLLFLFACLYPFRRLFPSHVALHTEAMMFQRWCSAVQCTEEGKGNEKESGFRNGEKLSLPREERGIVGSEDEE